jgi:hypothetical protein
MMELLLFPGAAASAATSAVAHAATPAIAHAATPAIAADPGDLEPVGALSLAGPLIIVIALCLLLAIGLLVAVVLLSRPARQSPDAAKPRGAHRGAGSTSVWLRRINDVVARHESGGLNREDAFVQLALIARDFAGASCGKELASSTLADLARLNRTPANRQGLDMLRQTISALYPPEFSNAAFDQSARAVSVEDAAEWVANLVERWRS